MCAHVYVSLSLSLSLSIASGMVDKDDLVGVVAKVIATGEDRSFRQVPADFRDTTSEWLS